MDLSFGLLLDAVDPDGSTGTTIQVYRAIPPIHFLKTSFYLNLKR